MVVKTYENPYPSPLRLYGAFILCQFKYLNTFNSSSSFWVYLWLFCLFIFGQYSPSLHRPPLSVSIPFYYWIPFRLPSIQSHVLLNTGCDIKKKLNFCSKGIVSLSVCPHLLPLQKLGNLAKKDNFFLICGLEANKTEWKHMLPFPTHALVHTSTYSTTPSTSFTRVIFSQFHILFFMSSIVV